VSLRTILSMCCDECLIEKFLMELANKITVVCKRLHTLLIDFGDLWLEMAGSLSQTVSRLVTPLP
jgi:hypothetical protein